MSNKELENKLKETTEIAKNLLKCLTDLVYYIDHDKQPLASRHGEMIRKPNTDKAKALLRKIKTEHLL